MTKIIGFAGKKQSGKGTSANILHGVVLAQKGMVSDWNIGGDGKLYIETKNANGETGWGEFDVTRKDPEFVQWAEYNMWPYVKIYSFADALKWIAVDLFDIPKELAFGNDEQKNTVMPHLLWENMPNVITTKQISSFMVGLNPPIKTSNNYRDYDQDFVDVFKFNIHNSGPMTVREFLQYFGTNICRKIYAPVWTKYAIKKIQQEGTELAIVADVRFPNEVEAITGAGGSVYKLTRTISDDNHASETALDNYGNFTKIIDNNVNGYTIDNLVQDIKQLYQGI